MRVRDSGGSLGSSHSVTSLSDCRRTHSIFHSSAVDSASALSLVTQEYPESAQPEKKNSLSHFSWLLRCCFCVISTDVFKYLPVITSSSFPGPTVPARLLKCAEAEAHLNRHVGGDILAEQSLTTAIIHCKIGSRFFKYQTSCNTTKKRFRIFSSVMDDFTV